MSSDHAKRWEHTWRTLLVFLFVLVLLVTAVIFGAVNLCKKTSAQLSDDLRAWFALDHLLTYNEYYYHLPPAQVRDSNGHVLHSWRFACGCLGMNDGAIAGYYHAIPNADKSWTDPVNARFTHPPFADFFIGPLDYIDTTREGCKARFAAIAGPGTTFDDKVPCRLANPLIKEDIQRSYEGAERKARMHEYQTTIEAPPFTVVLVEVRNSKVHWMEPGGDLDIRTMDHTIGQGTGNDPSGIHPDGFWVGFADGQMWFVSHEIPYKDLAKFFTLAGAREHDRRAVIGPYVLHTNFYQPKK